MAYHNKVYVFMDADEDDMNDFKTEKEIEERNIHTTESDVNANHSQEEKIISIPIGNQLSAAEIAAAMELSMSSTKRKIKSLIEKGYI